MSFCERNSMASKRSYETYTDVATAYKYAIEHLELLHESLPKEWIEEPGSIANNEHHPKRRMTKRESSYDMYDLLQANLAGFTMGYDQQGTSRETRKVEQQEQEAHEDMGMPCSSSWEEQRQHWITQYEKRLHTPSSKSKDPEEKRAGQWQSTQRTAYNNGTLSEERIKELMTSPGWEWRIQIIYRWEEQLQHWITQYEKRLQTPSSKSKDPEEKRAGEWQSIQRTAYNNGTLSEERIKELMTSPGWEWSAQREYRWEEQRQHWITQYEKRLQTPSSKSKDPEKKRAGIWQRTQRMAYNKGILSQEHIDELEGIPGWEWSAQREYRGWEEQRQHWITQYEKKRRVPSKASKDLEEKRAGVWQNHIRHAYKTGTLSHERIMDLEETEGWTWSAR